MAEDSLTQTTAGAQPGDTKVAPVLPPASHVQSTSNSGQGMQELEDMIAGLRDELNTARARIDSMDNVIVNLKAELATHA